MLRGAKPCPRLPEAEARIAAAWPVVRTTKFGTKRRKPVHPRSRLKRPSTTSVTADARWKKNWIERLTWRPAARRPADTPANTLKIATFNINNVRKRLPNLLDWLVSAKPHIVCLQELKTAQREFPVQAIQSAGYRAVWKGEKTWNGVAILSKTGEAIVTTTSLPGNPSDHQSRYIEAAIEGILIGCIYAPNGNPQPGPKFSYKLAWLDRLR